VTATRAVLVQRGLRLNYLTIAYNTVEAVVALIAGIAAGSVALLGFGIDSVIEVSASLAAQWRLRADLDPRQRELVEGVTMRIIGATFLALAIYVAYDSVHSLLQREEPAGSITGVVLLVFSVIVMPLLARAKRRVAAGLGSGALTADAKQTSLCAYLSVIALAGVGLNTLFGWWWADAAAALAMVPIIAKEGLDGIRGHSACADCADEV
jgi:divalent metal cation (Fe/Co/Zn/Cd) transporter